MTSRQLQVILVTIDDEPLGIMEKLEAHRKGELHRAFSVFIFDNAGRMLLQQRAKDKYHSGGLWTNACCGHPEPGDILESKAKVRLEEEMGISCELKYGFKFQYQANVGNGLIENELDHVFFGTCSSAPVMNLGEVSSWRYLSQAELKKEVTLHPENFTEWFKLIYEKAENFYLQSHSTILK